MQDFLPFCFLCRWYQKINDLFLWSPIAGELIGGSSFSTSMRTIPTYQPWIFSHGFSLYTCTTITSYFISLLFFPFNQKSCGCTGCGLGDGGREIHFFINVGTNTKNSVRLLSETCWNLHIYNFAIRRHLREILWIKDREHDLLLLRVVLGFWGCFLATARFHPIGSLYLGLDGKHGETGVRE